MKQYTSNGAKSFADSVWNLYYEMSKTFGNEKAWEFVIAFYKGAGSE